MSRNKIIAIAILVLCLALNLFSIATQGFNVVAGLGLIVAIVLMFLVFSGRLE